MYLLFNKLNSILHQIEIKKLFMLLVHLATIPEELYSVLFNAGLLLFGFLLVLVLVLCVCLVFCLFEFLVIGRCFLLSVLLCWLDMGVAEV